MIELSTAIKVPNINSFLTTFKVFQYYLQKPEHRKTERAADVSKAIVKKSSNAIASLEGIKIMRAEETNSGEWKLKYITVTNDYSIADLEKIISLALEITVSLERINCDFDTAVQLLYS